MPSAAVAFQEDAPDIPALTSIRAFAAMGIVILHFGLVTGIWVLPATWVLTQSLTLFFVLSGFILAYRYPALSSRRQKARFLGARVARIWVLHLLTLVIAALASPIPYQRSAGGTTFLLNALLLQAWVPVRSIYGSFNSPSFSISVELFFYLLFPLLIRGRGWAWIGKAGGALAVAIGMIVLADGFLLSLPDGVDVAGLVYNHPLARLWEFTLGIGAASVWRRLSHRILSRRSATVAEAAIVVLVVANVATASRAIGAVDGLAGLGPGAELWLSNVGLPALPIAGLLILLALGRGWLSRALEWRPLFVLGEISYSIYLLHGLLILPIVYRWNVVRGFQDAHLVVVYLAALVAASYLSWVFVEQPTRFLILRSVDGVLGRLAKGPAHTPRRRVWHPSVTLKALTSCATVLVLVGWLVVGAGPSRSPIPELMGKALGRFDSVGNKAPADGRVAIPGGTGAVRLSGWAVDGEFRSAARGVAVDVDGVEVGWFRAGLERPDVVQRHGDERYRFSGFAGSLLVDGLEPGSHRVSARLVLYRPEGYLSLPPIELRISS
ncbi:MAG: acyltransferase family protein [Actinomycetota bacterium]